MPIPMRYLWFVSKLGITGGSGSIARSLITEAEKLHVSTLVYSRSINQLSSNFISHQIVPNYDEISFDTEISKLIICNGLFKVGLIEEFRSIELQEFVDANLTSILKIIRSYLNSTKKLLRRDIFILGSTAGYDLGPKTSVYAICKFALRGAIELLNHQFEDSKTRFSLISYSTVNNTMGRKVPNQIESSLIREKDLAEEIIKRVFSEKNFFEPEIVIRRRSIQRH